ncbi:MAG: MoaD/ThiS family protein [Terricaulis sp.]
MARILFFGRLRDIAGCAMMEIAECGASLAELREVLARENPILGEALNDPSIRVAIDQVMVGREGLIEGTEEIAFMPPLSGG